MTTAIQDRPYQSIYTTWWFSKVVLLAICAGAIGLSVLMSPSDETLVLFGFEVPVLCGYRRTFGMPCIGCGLTRSFTFLAHGQVLDAFRLNLFGPPLFLVMAAQVPYRTWQLFQGLRGKR